MDPDEDDGQHDSAGKKDKCKGVAAQGRPQGMRKDGNATVDQQPFQDTTMDVDEGSSVQDDTTPNKDKGKPVAVRAQHEGSRKKGVDVLGLHHLEDTQRAMKASNAGLNTRDDDKFFTQTTKKYKDFVAGPERTSTADTQANRTTNCNLTGESTPSNFPIVPMAMLAGSACNQVWRGVPASRSYDQRLRPNLSQNNSGIQQY